jgi:hypothetical protein
MVHVILSSWDLDVQQGMFKLNMKKCSSNMPKVMALAFDKVNLVIVNPPTCM